MPLAIHPLLLPPLTRGVIIDALAAEAAATAAAAPEIEPFLTSKDESLVSHCTTIQNDSLQK